MRSPVTSRSNWAKESRIQSQPPHGARSVELLGDRDEGGLSLIEGFHDLGEVGERPRQSVHFIDHDHVDLAGGHIQEKPLEGGTLHGRAGKPAVVI